METDSALPDTVLDASLQKVRDASAVVVIVGSFYGQVPDTDRNPHRYSLTELEFREARRLDRPVLVFIMGSDHVVDAGHVEQDPERIEKLRRFRDEVKRAAPTSSVHRVYEFEVAANRSLAGLRRLLDSQPPTSTPARPAAVCSVLPLRGDEITRALLEEETATAVLRSCAGTAPPTVALDVGRCCST
jgi:hypothetical protein